MDVTRDKAVRLGSAAHAYDVAIPVFVAGVPGMFQSEVFIQSIKMMW
jgi:hypothetical protein